MSVKSFVKYSLLFCFAVVLLSNCVEKKGWQGRPFLRITSADLAPQENFMSPTL